MLSEGERYRERYRHILLVRYRLKEINIRRYRQREAVKRDMGQEGHGIRSGRFTRTDNGDM